MLDADGPNKYKNPRLINEAVRCKLVPLAPATATGVAGAPPSASPAASPASV